MTEPIFTAVKNGSALATQIIHLTESEQYLVGTNITNSLELVQTVARLFNSQRATMSTLSLGQRVVISGTGFTNTIDLTDAIVLSDYLSRVPDSTPMSFGQTVTKVVHYLRSGNNTATFGQTVLAIHTRSNGRGSHGDECKHSISKSITINDNILPAPEPGNEVTFDFQSISKWNPTSQTFSPFTKRVLITHVLKFVLPEQRTTWPTVVTYVDHLGLTWNGVLLVKKAVKTLNYWEYDIEIICTRDV